MTSRSAWPPMAHLQPSGRVMLADLLTKAVARPIFLELVRLLGRYAVDGVVYAHDTEAELHLALRRKRLPLKRDLVANDALELKLALDESTRCLDADPFDVAGCRKSAESESGSELRRGGMAWARTGHQRKGRRIGCPLHS